MLICLTLIALASARTGVMELRMADNDQQNVDALQTAQAAVDWVISDPTNFTTQGALDTATAVTLPSGLFSVNTTAGESLGASVTRTTDCALPPRTSTASSLVAFSAFSYRIAADVDKTSTGKGKASLREGYTVLGPKC